MSPALTQFTRTLGAHSTASVCVRPIRPALAAPYAAVPGLGRRPLTLAMLVMLAPPSCSCMTALARWLTLSGAMRFSAMMAVEKLGDAVAAYAAGAPTVVLT